MPLRDQDKYLITVKGEPKEVSDIRKKILNSFSDLVFIDEGHKYFLHEKELISVSSFVSEYEEEFDTDEKANAYAEKHGETADYWKDQWRFTNLKATVTGTQVHSYSESLCWLHLGHPENITEDNKYKYVEDKGWLIPTRPKEESALKFWTEFPENLWPVLPETKVYTNDSFYKRNYAGTFDLLCYYKHPTDDTKSGLVILDYKTNNDIYKEFSRTNNKMMYYPFNDLYMEPLGGYSIQLSCYQLCLEDIGLKVIGRRLIWLKPDGTYELIPTPCLTDKIRTIIK